MQQLYYSELLDIYCSQCCKKVNLLNDLEARLRNLKANRYTHTHSHKPENSSHHSSPVYTEFLTFLLLLFLLPAQTEKFPALHLDGGWIKIILLLFYMCCILSFVFTRNHSALCCRLLPTVSCSMPTTVCLAPVRPAAPRTCSQTASTPVTWTSLKKYKHWHKRSLTTTDTEAESCSIEMSYDGGSQNVGQVHLGGA